MKIGVIGTFNRDTVRLPNGKTRQGWGGILYNIAALSKLLGNRHQIYPVANVGEDAFATIARIIKKLHGVKTDYLNKVAEKNNHCFLTYTDYENKSEILKGRVKQLKYDNVRPLLDCNIILLNYISGRDIYLKALQKFRQNYAGKIYIDVHSLTLGKRKDGRRYLRRPPHWISVVECGDYIQMNRLELGLLASGGRQVGRGAVKPERLMVRLVEILDRCQVDMEKKVFISTGGNQGCYLYYHSGQKWKFREIKAFDKASLMDTTGCGDCFSAGFIAGLVGSEELSGCAKRANRIALKRIEGKLKIFQNA